MPTFRQMSETVSPLARSRSASRSNRATSSAVLRLLMGPSVSQSTRRLPFRLDQFLGSRPEAKGFEGRELDELVDSVTCAARHRLVFLTSRVEGELAFEVRGLQEYMAAECVMTGPTEDVVNRLRAIAPSPYWRNVFLFAAGKCFFDAQSRHYQDPLLVLCGDLNDSADVVLERVHAGSELGLAVLESGAPAKNPTYTRHLSKLALVSVTVSEGTTFSASWGPPRNQ